MRLKALNLLNEPTYSSLSDGSMHNHDNGKVAMGIGDLRQVDCPNQCLMRGNGSVYLTGYANAIVLQRLF
jgi:hypothetical protein